MSATDIPVLDLKNLTYLKPRYGIASRAIHDPVAKLWIAIGVASRNRYMLYGDNHMVMKYCPDLSLELVSEPMTEKKWEKLGLLHRDHSIEVASAIVDYDIREKAFVAIADTDGFYGIGLPGVDPYRHPGLRTWIADDPRYIFWPENVGGKNEIVGPYFLNFIMSLLHEKVTWGRKEQIRDGLFTHCGVAIDQALADHIGLQHFPDAERMNDGLILILKKDVRDAG